MIIRLSGLAAVFAASVSGVAMAQSDFTYPEVIRDLGPGYNMSEGSLPAIAGVAPGMTQAEVETILTPLALEGLNYYDEVQSIQNPEDGRQFSFGYRTSVTATLVPNVEGSYDSISVHFATNLTGGRVNHIERTVSYSSVDPAQMPGFEATIAAIIDSYGEPTHQLDTGAGLMLYFTYWNGALDSDSEPHFKQCQYLDQNYVYTFQQEREDWLPDCTALIVVTALRDYRVEKSLLQLEIELTDYRRSFDDAVIADQYLLDGLEAADEKSNGPAVKL